MHLRTLLQAEPYILREALLREALGSEVARLDSGSTDQGNAPDAEGGDVLEQPGERLGPGNGAQELATRLRERLERAYLHNHARRLAVDRDHLRLAHAAFEHTHPKRVARLFPEELDHVLGAPSLEHDPARLELLRPHEQQVQALAPRSSARG